MTVCGVTVCPFSRHKGNQRPKCLLNKAQMHLSRNCPFSNKTNLHLEFPVIVIATFSDAGEKIAAMFRAQKLGPTTRMVSLEVFVGQHRNIGIPKAATQARVEHPEKLGSGNHRRPESQGFKKLSEFGHPSLQGHKSSPNTCFIVFRCNQRGADDL